MLVTFWLAREDKGGLPDARGSWWAHGRKGKEPQATEGSGETAMASAGLSLPRLPVGILPSPALLHLFSVLPSFSIPLSLSLASAFFSLDFSVPFGVISPLVSVFLISLLFFFPCLSQPLLQAQALTGKHTPSLTPELVGVCGELQLTTQRMCAWTRVIPVCGEHFAQTSLWSCQRLRSLHWGSTLQKSVQPEVRTAVWETHCPVLFHCSTPKLAVWSWEGPNFSESHFPYVQNRNSISLLGLLEDSIQLNKLFPSDSNVPGNVWVAKEN